MLLLLYKEVEVLFLLFFFFFYSSIQFPSLEYVHYLVTLKYINRMLLYVHILGFYNLLYII